MVYQDGVQPANRSGSVPSICQPSATNCNGDGGGPSIPFVIHAENGLTPPPAMDGLKENATQEHALSHDIPSLQIRTDLPGPDIMSTATDPGVFIQRSLSSGSLPQRTPSLRALRRGANSSAGAPSPVSTASPLLVAMGDITPLPSPIGGLSSWKLSKVDSQSLSRTSSSSSRPGSGLGLRVSDSNQKLVPAPPNSRSKQYAADPLETPTKIRRDGPPHHARNRSLSEYVPPGRSVAAKTCPIIVSAAGALGGIAQASSSVSKPNELHREHYLGVHRGIASTTPRPPTPPRSSRGGDADSDHEAVIHHASSVGLQEEIYSVRSVQTQQPRKYRKIRQLGQGTFSEVSLAVRMEPGVENGASEIPNLDGMTLTPHRLVAIKIIEFGPAGGADEERVEVSLKREVEILKSVNHPSLVQLKAFGSDDKRALLVLDYCPGGDLFDVASSKPRPMPSEVIRRIFAELVAAVRYLHKNFIVHRDIKLESERTL